MIFYFTFGRELYKCGVGRQQPRVFSELFAVAKHIEKQLRVERQLLFYIAVYLVFSSHYIMAAVFFPAAAIQARQKLVNEVDCGNEWMDNLTILFN